MPSSIRMRVQSVALLICALAGAACGNPSAPSGPQVTVSIGVQGAEPVNAVMRTRLGSRVVDLTLKDASHAARMVVAPRAAPLPVSVVLMTPAGDTLATTQFTHEFSRGADHWVTAFVGRNREPYFCEGVVTRTPLIHTLSDTLFVTHGSLPHGAVC